MNCCFEFLQKTINDLRSYIKHSKVFHPVSKHLEVGLKKSAVPRFFKLLLGVWNSDETLSLVFDILLDRQYTIIQGGPGLQKKKHNVVRKPKKKPHGL